MYHLTDDRRITQFIKSEARNWLYNRIHDNEYIFKGDDSKKLSEEIFRKREVTEELYGKFLKMFDNNPIKQKVKCLLNKEATIVSDKIYFHFIKYNNYTLPIGFIIDFFEDDYEDKERIKNLIKGFLEESKEETITQWGATRFRFVPEVDKQKTSLANVYKCGVKTYIKYFFIICFFVIILGGLLKFVNTSKLLDVFKGLISNKLNLRADINIPDGIPEFNLSEKFNIGTYLKEIGFVLWINVYILLYLLLKIPRFVRETKYIITCTYIKIVLFSHKNIAKKCEDTGAEKLKYLSEELILEYLNLLRNESIVNITLQPEVKKIINMFGKLDKYNSKSYAKYKNVVNKKGINTKFMVFWMALVAIVCYIVNTPSVIKIISGWFEMFLNLFK